VLQSRIQGQPDFGDDQEIVYQSIKKYNNTLVQILSETSSRLLRPDLEAASNKGHTCA